MQSPDQVSVIAVPAKMEKINVEYCIALYDYDASAQDELTFEENQIITIVNKSPHGVDDGWWEGNNSRYCIEYHSDTILSNRNLYAVQVRSMAKLEISHRWLWRNATNTVNH